MGDFKRVCRVDTYAREDKPRKNFGPVRWLQVGGTSTTERYAYLFFALPDTGIIQNGVTIVSAQLRVYLAEAWAGGPHTVTAKRITQSWKESKLTWNNQPNVSTTNSVAVAVTGGAIHQEMLFNITALMSQVVSGAAFYGIRLELDTTTARKLHSGETLQDAKRPVLEVVYTIKPDPPSELRPNGETGSVQRAAPTFHWAFNSDDVEESQGESRVRVYSNAALSTIVYDSGWDVNTENEWDSSLDVGPPSLLNNTQYWWTVAVRDSSGNESAASEAATFWRDVKPTLTIVSPATDNATVDTTTPLIDWTLTDTQIRWRGFLDEKLTGKRWKRVLQDGGVGATTEWLIEPGWIRYQTSEASYRVIIRSWEAHVAGRVRIATQGDPTYNEAIRLFSYNPNGVPAAPTGLVATHSGAGMLLSWFQASIPDDFVISANGKVRKVLDPAEVSLGGGNYEWRTYEYEPQKDVLWQVRAVVNNQTSNPASYSLTANLVGAWLVDIDDKVELFLAGQAKFSSQIGETGNTFFPIGRRAPVRIVDSIRGMEGTLQGQIIAHNGVTAEQWYNRAIELKERAPGTVLRLLYGRHNFPVVIGELTIDQDAGPEHQHDVTIPFWQVGDFDIDVET